MIWVPPIMAYLKHPEPGAWQKAADEMQASVLRARRRAFDATATIFAIGIASDFGERGTSERPDPEAYVVAVFRAQEALEARAMRA